MILTSWCLAAAAKQSSPNCRAARIVAGIIETADIGWTGWHPAYACRSGPRRAGIWRARGAAGASRRPARGTARAGPATATLSKREVTGETSSAMATMDITDVLAIPESPFEIQ
jgi:hypothetical protein